MRETIIEVLRFIKGIFQYFAELQVLGIHIDFVFHFFVALLLVLILLRFFPKKKTILIVTFFIVIKELADIFGKSRIEYIRAPGLDLLIDLSMGFLGLFTGLYLAKKIAERKK